MDLTPNAVIAGRYRVEAKVGAGGMGEVWVGQLLGSPTRVAIKTLLPAAAMHNEVVARFKREAYILGRIQSSNVARVIDFVADDVYGLVLVMEFVEGDPLSRMLQERTLTLEEAVDLAIGLATALKDLHGANIIHRDLKPGNIIMAPLPDGRRRAVVVDFGVSRIMSDKSVDEDEELTGITRADMAVGTIEYMAPEQILNSRNVTPGSDIYAAGAMLYRACAGRHVFGTVQSDAELAQKKLTTESPPLPLMRNDKVAEGLAAVVGRMVKRRPSERYKTADEVLADLAPVHTLMRPPAGAAAPAAQFDTESATIDIGKGLPAAAQPVTAPQPTPAQAAQVAQAAPAAVPTPIATAQPAAAAPAGRDSSASVAAPAPRRGVSPVLTAALVVIALGGGVFLGPQLVQRGILVTSPAGETAAPTATAAPAPPTAAATATAETAAPAASASAAPATTAAADAGAVAATGAADAGAALAKPAKIPGPMPSVRPAATSVPLDPPSPL
jgi:eukaryotic-like serine/threonine-protein kinase